MGQMVARYVEVQEVGGGGVAGGLLRRLMRSGSRGGGERGSGDEDGGMAVDGGEVRVTRVSDGCLWPFLLHHGKHHLRFMGFSALQ